MSDSSSPSPARLVSSPRKIVARRGNGHVTLAAITDHVEAREPYHVTALRFGAQHAAAALGYQFEVFRVRVRERRYWILDKMLRNPEVEGVLLLPTVNSADLTNYVDWQRLPVVAATQQVTAPEFHRVVADQFGNAVCLCEHLLSLGRRRFGYVARGMSDNLSERQLSAAINWLNPSISGQPITLSCSSTTDRTSVCDWFDLQRPEVIITDTDLAAECLAEELGTQRRKQVKLALYEHAGSPHWSGIDHRHRAIGAAAIGQLHARIQAGDKGIPDIPTTMTIKGEWIEAIASDVALAI